MNYSSEAQRPSDLTAVIVLPAKYGVCLICENDSGSIFLIEKGGVCVPMPVDKYLYII